MDKIPNTFEEAMAYFDDYIFYEPAHRRTRYLEAVAKKFIKPKKGL